jgi:predicted nuclease of predicted toxin-antitoxin system
MDENVPRQITTGLRLRGIDTLTVQDDGLTGSPDPQVFARATELQRVIFTRDDHYLVIHNAWHNDSRTYGCAIHLDIIDGQVWTPSAS